MLRSQCRDSTWNVYSILRDDVLFCIPTHLRASRLQPFEVFKISAHSFCEIFLEINKYVTFQRVDYSLTDLVYGRTSQHAKEEDTSPKLHKEKINFDQQVTCTFIYYIRAVYATVMICLSEIAADQAAPTEKSL